jgi:Trp operon repressor
MKKQNNTTISANTSLHKKLSSYEAGDISVLNLLTSLFTETAPKDFSHLLESLFTKAEIKSFANRLLIIKKLKEGSSQHAIAGKIKVGVETVSRGASELKKGKFKFI